MNRTFAAAALLFALSSSAFAGDIYVVAGFGRTSFREDPADGLWKQQGFSDMAEKSSNAWKVGVGLKLHKNVSFEMDWRDLGTFNQYSLAVGDTGGPGTYNLDTHQCNGKCEPTSAIYQRGYTKGIGLSFVAAPDWNIAPYIRAGYMYQFSNFYTAQKFGATPYQQNLAVLTYDADGHRGSDFKDRSFSRMYGFGIRADWLELEYTVYKDVGATLGPWHGAQTIMMNVRHEF